MVLPSSQYPLGKYSRRATGGRRRAETKSSFSAMKLLVFFVAITALDVRCSRNIFRETLAFQTNLVSHHSHSLQQQRNRIIQWGGKSDGEDSVGTKEDMNLLTKSSWYAVELFGNVFGKKGKPEDALNDTTEISLSKGPSSLDETLQRINDDNDRYYFLSGEIDSLIYDEECVFADPFVSFAGRDRFIQNLQNLGSFITKYDAKVLDYSSVTYEDSIPIIQTKIMVKLELNLPWKPVLAWPWGVKYEIDPETFLVKRHEESWNIEPLEGVKMIFRAPTVKL